MAGIEPMKGIEPLTYALRERRSTPELHRRDYNSGFYRIFGLLVKFIIPTVLFLSCATPTPPNPKPGVFEVSILDEKDIYRLDGEWLFESKFLGSPQTIKVPGYWNNLISGHPPHSKAIYRAHLILPRVDQLLSLDIGEIQTAYRVYVDDKLIGGLGNPDDTSESGVKMGPQVLIFRSSGPIDLKIEVGNYFNPIGGIGDSILIGQASSVHQPRFAIKLYYLVVDGIMVFLLVYFLIFSVFGYRKPTFLSLSGLIFFSLIRDNLLNQRLISMYFPDLSSALLTKLEYVTIFGVAVCFVAYLWQFFQEQNFKPPFLILGAFSILYLILLITLPFGLFVSLFRFYIFLTLLTLIFLIANVILRHSLPRKHRIIFFLSLLPLFFGAAHDLFQGFFMMGNLYFFNSGVTIYLLLQAGILHRIHRNLIASVLKLQQENRQLQQSRSALLVAFLPKFRSKLQEVLQLVDQVEPDFQRNMMDYGLHRLESVFHIFNKCFHNGLEIDWEEVDRLVKTLPEPKNLEDHVDTGQKLTALVVDDEGINRFLVKSLLNKEGLHVIEAENGHQAIEYLASETPDIILIDIMMPVLNGYETILELKKRHNTLPPFCFLTAKSDNEDINHSLRLGACGFQTKPFSIKAFFPKLQDYLLLHRCPPPLTQENPVVLRLKLMNFHQKLTPEDIERIDSCRRGSFPHFHFDPTAQMIDVHLPPTQLIHQILSFLLVLDGVNIPMIVWDIRLSPPQHTQPGLILSRSSLEHQIPNLASSVFLQELDKDVFFFSWHSARSPT